MKKAFTLAEVLITLGIIGVIASTILNIMINNYRKTHTVNRLKETYNKLSQAFNLAIIEHDAPSNWMYDDSNLDLFVEKYLAPYLKIIAKSSVAPDHYYASGNKIGFIYQRRTHYYLANGVELTIFPYADTHYLMIIDLNGTKGPNKMGIDCFLLQFSKNITAVSVSKLFTMNGIFSGLSRIKLNCNKNSEGTHCGAWIMLEGWKIPEGYPFF